MLDASDAIHVALGLLQRHARLEHADNIEVVLVVLGATRGIEGDRNPEFFLRDGRIEAGRHDADHGADLPVELDRPADHAGVAAVVRAPEALAQDRPRRRCPAGLRLGTEYAPAATVPHPAPGKNWR